MIDSKKIFDDSEEAHPITEDEFIKIENIKGKLLMIGSEDDCLFLICNESDGTNPKDEKWAKKIGGMKIYNEMQLRTMLEKVGFCDIKSFVDAKKHWLCIVAKK